MDKFCFVFWLVTSEVNMWGVFDNKGVFVDKGERSKSVWACRKQMSYFKRKP